jgi:hypothetical protein
MAYLTISDSQNTSTISTTSTIKKFVLKFSPKTVDLFLNIVHNISTFQQIPPPLFVISGGTPAGYAPSSINYQLTDLNTRKFESFKLKQDNLKGFSSNIINDIKSEGSDHFTGVEWWNTVEEMPYPIRYEFMLSLLQYGLHDSSDAQKITYHPYNSLVPDNDKNSKRYPVLFRDARVMKGCICYSIATGDSNAGL